MSIVSQKRGGWWHDYVCPTHGTELLPPDGGAHPCAHGCRLVGEPYAAAWTVLDHQNRAREARLLARRAAATGSAADRERAARIVTEFARLYRDLDDGWNQAGAEWMLRGRLFAQALTEAIWAVQLADAVSELAGPGSDTALGTEVVELLENLLATVVAARRILVTERDQFRNNYTAWLDAAGGSLSRALTALGRPTDPWPWVERTVAHLEAVVGDDGWEWEGSTYYHLFVLRAYLLNLRGVDPQDLPTAAVRRLAAMIAVLASLATPAGRLPALHDGPYDREPMHLEVLEVCALAGQLFADPGLGQVKHWALARVGHHDGLEELLAGWFAGPPLPAAAPTRASVLFADVGYAVLREAGDTWQAVLDAGPHGGSHGHLDKLGLYLYGSTEEWQPAPGVPPYASPLRRGHYARTIAHPTVRVDGRDQQESAGVIEHWDAEQSHVVAFADEAFDGVRLRREVLLADGYLLDIVTAHAADEPREMTLALRPGVGLEVRAGAAGWTTCWSAAAAGGRSLHGLHRSLGAAQLIVAPGRGPADDPARLLAVADWTAHAGTATFVSVYRPDDAAAVDAVELVTDPHDSLSAVRIRRGSSRTEHEVNR